MTKKRSSEILADESEEIFRQKVKLLQIFRKSENFSEIGGKSETGGENASWSQGGWTPLMMVEVRGHPFMTSTKNHVFDPPYPLSTCLYMGQTPSPLWTSTHGRHEIHTALLKWLVQ